MIYLLLPFVHASFWSTELMRTHVFQFRICPTPTNQLMSATATGQRNRNSFPELTSGDAHDIYFDNVLVDAFEQELSETLPRISWHYPP